MLPPLVRIDWLLVRGLTPVSASVGEAPAGDHRPVLVDLSFEEAR